MTQVQKPHVRQAIVAAAAKELAEVGYERAKLTHIAQQAGTSIGNLYKYFESKEALLAAAIPLSLVSQITSLLRARVEALGIVRDVVPLEDAHPYRAASEELDALALSHRHELVFLLSRAEGTAHAGFAEQIAQRLTKLALEYAARAYPDTQMNASRKRALARIYRGFVASLATILREEASDRAVREALTLFSTYHLAGLKAFFENAAREESS